MPLNQLLLQLFDPACRVGLILLYRRNEAADTWFVPDLVFARNQASLNRCFDALECSNMGCSHVFYCMIGFG